MGEAGRVVSDTLHDRQLSGIPQRLESGEAGVETYLIIESDDVLLRDGYIGPQVIITPVAVRNNRVKPIIPAGLLNDYQDTSRR